MDNRWLWFLPLPTRPDGKTQHRAVDIDFMDWVKRDRLKCRRENVYPWLLWSADMKEKEWVSGTAGFSFF